jgi:sugar phosphate isomerase/epimerase
MPNESHQGAVRLAGIGDEAATTLAGQVAAVRELDWQSIELRTVDGIAVADLDDHAFRSVAEAVRTAGLDVVCLDSRAGNWGRPINGRFEDDLAEIEILADRCPHLGTRFVRIMSYPNAGLPEPEWRRLVLERMRRLTERAERAGIVLLHENCSGWAGGSAERTLHLLDTVKSPSLRVLFDTGNGVAHGYPGYDLLLELLPYVDHVHVKDGIEGAGEPVYTLPGDGQARVADCLRLLLASGYDGALSIEPHLATLPHAGQPATGDAARQFVAAGRRLRQLCVDEVFPVLASPGIHEEA